jgi:hypothetical protein
LVGTHFLFLCGVIRHGLLFRVPALSSCLNLQCLHHREFCIAESSDVRLTDRYALVAVDFDVILRSLFNNSRSSICCSAQFCWRHCGGIRLPMREAITVYRKLHIPTRNMRRHLCSHCSCAIIHVGAVVTQTDHARQQGSRRVSLLFTSLMSPLRALHAAIDHPPQIA